MTHQVSIANFVIGGADKAGTTSVFTYLSQHPAVSASTQKETDFFRNEFTGDLSRDCQTYSRYFNQRVLGPPIIMEASPAYLRDADVVAPRMAKLIPDARILFILRNPVERLYSSYNFRVGKLTIPGALHFDEYVSKSLGYERGCSSAPALEFEAWFLKSMRVGRYVDFLSPFLEAFPRQSIQIMFFEQLCLDTRRFMTELSGFLGIDAAIWGQHQFDKENVTVSVSSKKLHQLAMQLNSKGERFLRQHPALKRALRDMYRKVNRARQGYEPMSLEVRATLYDYYRESNEALRLLLQDEIPESWAGPVALSPSLALRQGA